MKKIYLRCAYFEIYNDLVYDLLDSSAQKLSEPLPLIETQKKEFAVKGLGEVPVSTFEQCLDLLKIGEQTRSYAQTKMNHHSSRSHTLYRLTVDTVGFDAKQCCSSVLTFVDLAGSEKASIHESHRNRPPSPFSLHPNTSPHDRVREGQHINKSLFFLTQVINLKATGSEDTHIPYRNSPLTKILKGSLGGNSRTSVILCITPCLS